MDQGRLRTPCRSGPTGSPDTLSARRASRPSRSPFWDICLPNRCSSSSGRRLAADVIVVLGGDASDRPWKALELYRQGRAPAIFIAGGGTFGFIRRRFEIAGVPTNSLCGEWQSRTTCENAQVSVPLLRARGAKRVILVTSWYHSRRALACFRHFAPEIEFYSMPSYNAISMEHKPGPSEAFYVFSEYLKTSWYVLRHGIWPTEGNRGR